MYPQRERESEVKKAEGNFKKVSPIKEEITQYDVISMKI
jgi:hypothetical protein